MSKQKQKLGGLLEQFENKKQANPANRDDESLSFQATHRTPENPLSAHINVRTTPEFRDEVKLYAVQAGVTLQELVDEALRRYMSDNPVSR